MNSSRNWDTSVAGEVPQFGLRGKPEPDECFESWLLHITGISGVEPPEFFDWLTLPRHWAALDWASLSRATKNGVLHAAIERFASAFAVDPEVLTASLIPGPPAFLLAKSERIYGCPECVAIQLKNVGRAYRRRAWYLRATWFCIEHRLALQPIWADGNRTEIVLRSTNKPLRPIIFPHLFLISHALLESGLLAGCADTVKSFGSDYAETVAIYRSRRGEHGRSRQMEILAEPWSTGKLAIWDGPRSDFLLEADKRDLTHRLNLSQLDRLAHRLSKTSHIVKRHQDAFNALSLRLDAAMGGKTNKAAKQLNELSARANLVQRRSRMRQEIQEAKEATPNATAAAVDALRAAIGFLSDAGFAMGPAARNDFSKVHKQLSEALIKQRKEDEVKYAKRLSKTFRERSEFTNKGQRAFQWFIHSSKKVK